MAVAPIALPEALKGLESRAVRIRPDVVLSCTLVDLNIVLERPELPVGERFDLIVATNVLVYYDTLEQALALQNLSTMLKPGGYVLSNERLPELPEVHIRSTGYTSVRYSDGAAAGDNIFWYQKS